MTKHLMIDIETLATTPDAAILTIGAVKFDPYGDDRDKATRRAETFYKRIDLDSNVELGRTINEDTLRWWCDQSEDISHEAFVEEEQLKLLKSRHSSCLEVSLEEAALLQTNLLHTAPDTLVIDPRFRRLGAALENQGYRLISCPLDMVGRMGGLFRCSTLPLRRS